MKKLLLIIAMCLGLAGCATAPQAEVKPSVVVQYKYVAAPIPDDALVIPANVERINLETASQKEVADWLARSEGRSLDIENKLKSIKKEQDKRKAQETK